MKGSVETGNKIRKFVGNVDVCLLGVLYHRHPIRYEVARTYNMYVCFCQRINHHKYLFRLLSEYI